MTVPVSGIGNGRKKSIVWGNFEKIKKGEGDTSNLLAHVPNCPKNPNREDLVKGQQTLPFEPKNDGEDGF